MNIEITTAPDAKDLKTVTDGMRAYEVSRLPDLPEESEDILVAAFARADDGKICGGIKANVYWNGVEIDVLWVSKDHRGKDIGSSLIQKVEDFARDNGAVVAYLKTVDARGFYESCGYEVYGTLEDRPIGTVLYHMKKRLQPD